MIMKKSILLFIFCFVYLAGFAQQREERNLSSFNELSVGEAIRVNLIKGSREKAEIIASGIDMEDILTEVSGNGLRIHLKGNSYRNIDVRIELTYRELDEISISSAARVVASEAITASSLEIDVSSAGKGELNLDAGNVEIEVSSAGNLELTGKADRLEIDVSSAGDLDAYGLQCQEAEIDVSSGGSADVHITERIDARANSGGTIRYKGEPEKVFVNSNSGGSVKKRD
jgi:hypothetical protein